MWRYGLRQAEQLALGLLGALLLAALVSALSGQGHPQDLQGFGRSFWLRLAAAAHFDFGTSGLTGRSAWAELSKSLPATLELVCVGGIVSLLIGVPLGVLLAAGRSLRAGAPLIQLVAAAPAFCAALGLLWLANRTLHWSGPPRAVSLVSAMSRGNPADIEAALRSIALPGLTVGAAGVAAVQLSLRHVIRQALAEPYRRHLQAMGLGRFEIDRLYLLPRIAAGLLMSAGEIASSLLAATAVAEWVFNRPGAAELFLKSVALEDWTVAGLILFMFAALTAGVKFLCALASGFLAETGAAVS